MTKDRDGAATINERLEQMEKYLLSGTAEPFRMVRFKPDYSAQPRGIKYLDGKGRDLPDDQWPSWLVDGG